MSEDTKKRFFKPNINEWKYKTDKSEDTTSVTSTSTDSEEDLKVSDQVQSTTVKKRFEFFNWTLSFTKNVVQACFILFLIVNIFIAAMITYIYFTTQQIVALETYISEVYNMFITVIGGYIIKSATENTVKIVFSVLSDWLEKKYGIEDRLKEPEDPDPVFIVGDGAPNPNYTEESGITNEDLDLGFGGDESGETVSDDDSEE